MPNVNEIEQMHVATRYDSPLRYHVTSASRPHERHIVELDAYRLHGRCTCEAFAYRLEPHIRKGISPEQAVAEGLVNLRAGQDVRDGLSCKHLIECRRQFAADMTREFHEHAKKNANEARRSFEEDGPY